MSKTVRFGVSIDAELLQGFDGYCATRGYENRSEAIRDLIRDALISNTVATSDREAAGTVTLVYDHHKSDLAQKLTAMQHDAHDLIISALHVHLDHDSCLEVLVLRGPVQAIQELSALLLAVKGVTHGRFILTSPGGAVC